jgi:hypothetical protein
LPTDDGVRARIGGAVVGPAGLEPATERSRVGPEDDASLGKLLAARARALSFTMSPSMQRTDADPSAYLDAIEHPVRQRDARELAALMTDVAGEAPAMWGVIVGWGSYHYDYDSSHSGDFCRIGFAAGKQRLSLYGLRDAPGSETLLARLGKHKTGVGCVYVNKLDDVDRDVLREVIERAWAHPRG